MSLVSLDSSRFRKHSATHLFTSVTLAFSLLLLVLCHGWKIEVLVDFVTACVFSFVLLIVSNLSIYFRHGCDDIDGRVLVARLSSFAVSRKKVSIQKKNE